LVEGKGKNMHYEIITGLRNLARINYGFDYANGIDAMQRHFTGRYLAAYM